MKIKQLKESQSSISSLCESYTLSEYKSFDEIIKTYNDLRKENPKKQVLFTLDDLNQAEYTSSHATMSYDLDETDDYDLSGVDSCAFEDGEHLGYLSTASEFFIRKANFEKQVVNMDFSNVCKKGLTLDEEEAKIQQKINENPFCLFDEKIIIKIVPVDVSYKAIYGFPNGYFSSDLNPFENYALAKYLYEKYDYEFFGLGASFLGFFRKELLNKKEIKNLTIDLNRLYNNQNVLEKFNYITKSNFLFIKYIESIEDYEQ